MNKPDAWNYLASSFHFLSYPQQASVTFSAAYQGSDFSTDFEAIKRGVGNLTGSGTPNWDGNDLLNASLQ